MSNIDNNLQRESWSSLSQNEKNSLRTDLARLLNHLREIDSLDNKTLEIFDLQSEINLLRIKHGESRARNSELARQLKTKTKKMRDIKRRFTSLQKSSDPKAYIELQTKLKLEKENSKLLVKKYDESLEELDISLEQYGLAFSAPTGRVYKPINRKGNRKRVKHFAVEYKKISQKKLQK